MMLNRRDALGALGSLAGAALVLPKLAWAQAKELVFTSWGGTTQEAQAAAWAVPFTKETGVKVLQDGPIDYGKLKAMVDSGNVQWDVVDVEQDFALFAAKNGMLEPLDFTVIKREDLDPRFVSDHGVGSFYYAWVIGYSQGAYGSNQPGGWADLFDLAKFPGKRAYYKWCGPGVYEIPLLADGVKPEQLYPLDLDRAFKKMDSIKKQTVWWGTGAQSQQLLASGETPMGMFWSGRLHSLVKDGTSVGVQWNQNLTAADLLVIPKGSKNKDLAMKFLAVASSPEGQAEMAKRLGYSPTNLKSLALLDQDTIDSLPSHYAAMNIPIDIQYWADHRTELDKRWYNWQAG
jgi:putative spermidine/putrescine transport system substrate-binding protein